MSPFLNGHIKPVTLKWIDTDWRKTNLICQLICDFPLAGLILLNTWTTFMHELNVSTIFFFFIFLTGTGNRFFSKGKQLCEKFLPWRSNTSFQNTFRIFMELEVQECKQESYIIFLPQDDRISITSIHFPGAYLNSCSISLTPFVSWP